MSAAGLELRICPDGREVFQLLYPGAPDSCAKPGQIAEPPTDREGYLTSPTGPNGLELAPWLTNPASQPGMDEPLPETEAKKECNCHGHAAKGSGRDLIFMLLTLLWLTS
jgi:hypothetical protein